MKLPSIFPFASRKNLFARVFLALGTVLLSGATLSAATATLSGNPSTPLNVAIYHQLPPFGQIKEHQFRGLLVDFSKPLQQQLQRPIRFHSMPLGRDVIEFIKGNMDVAFLLDIPGIFTPPSKNMAYVTPSPIMSFPLNIYYMTSREQELVFPESFEKMSDLIPLKLGAIRAGGENNFGVEDTEWQHVTSFNQYEGLTKALLAKRVDLAMMDSLTAAYWKNNYGFELTMKYHLNTVHVYAAFSRISLGEHAQSVCTDYWQQLLNHLAEQKIDRLISQPNFQLARNHILVGSKSSEACQEMAQIFTTATP